MVYTVWENMDLLMESRYIMQLFIIILLCWLGWLCGLAFGQVGEAFTGSTNFPDIGITCITNLAAFIRFILRGKLWVKQRAEYAVAAGIGQKSVKLNNITGVVCGLSTCVEELSKCSVVMLAKQTPNSWKPRSNFSIRTIIRYMYKVHDVHSIFLQYLPLEYVAITVEICTENHEGRCGCIIFNTVEDITTMLARRLPGTVKRLSDSLCLLPSLQCLISGCHGCKQGLLHVENDILTEGKSQVDSPAAVCELLDLKSIHKERTCICIPVRLANDDEWTNQLITFFKPSDKEFREAVIRKGRTNASSALENYKNGNGECDAVEKYNFASLFQVPWLTRALINLVLTFWLKVDGFSSAVFAATATQDYDPTRNLGKLYTHQFLTHQLLTKAHIKSNANNNNVCQVLFLRSALQRWIISGFLNEFVICICCISWIVLVALEGGANKWYHTHSMPPSKPRIAVILVGISIALVMDGLDLKLCLKIRRMPSCRGKHSTLMICAIIVLEILCIVACSSIAGVMGIKVFGTWIYSLLQCLVLVKWQSGFYLLNRTRRQLLSQESPEYGEPTWWYNCCGLYIQCSAFLLNATLAGVRAKWGF